MHGPQACTPRSRARLSLAFSSNLVSRRWLVGIRDLLPAPAEVLSGELIGSIHADRPFEHSLCFPKTPCLKQCPAQVIREGLLRWLELQGSFGRSYGFVV